MNRQQATVFVDTLIVVAGFVLLGFYIFYPGKIWDEFIDPEDSSERIFWYCAAYLLFFSAIYFLIIRKHQTSPLIIVVLFCTLPTISSGSHFQVGSESSNASLLSNRQNQFNTIEPTIVSLYNLFHSRRQHATYVSHMGHYYTSEFDLEKPKGIVHSNILRAHFQGLLLTSGLFLIFARKVLKSKIPGIRLPANSLPLQ